MKVIGSKGKLNKLEKAVMDKLLQGEDIVLGALRDQLKFALVELRRTTNAGFFLHFSLPQNSLGLTEITSNVKSDFCFGDVGAETRELQYGAGFLLWVEDGRLHMLEGYSYEEPWPEEIEEYQLNYYSEPRDIARLQRQWLISPNE